MEDGKKLLYMLSGVIALLILSTLLPMTISTIQDFISGTKPADTQSNTENTDQRENKDKSVPHLSGKLLHLLYYKYTGTSIDPITEELISELYPDFYKKYSRDRFSKREYQDEYNQRISQLKELLEEPITRKTYIVRIPVRLSEYNFEYQGFYVNAQLNRVDYQRPKRNLIDPNNNGVLYPVVTNTDAFYFVNVSEKRAERVSRRSADAFQGWFYWDPQELKIEQKTDSNRDRRIARILGDASKMKLMVLDYRRYVSIGETGPLSEEE